MYSNSIKDSVHLDGARARVTPLLKDGEKWPDGPPGPLEGYIRFYAADSFRGAVLEFNKNTGNMPMTLLKPLGDPGFGRWDERGLVVIGWEASTVDEYRVENRQAWLVVVLPD